jgi:protocadherin Fat 1/2/3
VTASDSLLSTSTSLNIAVSELPPSGLRFYQEKYFGKVQEELSSVTRVALVQAMGKDLNEHLTYRLLTPTSYFSIGETSGVLHTTGVPLDREVRSNHLLLVEVRNRI